MLNCMEHDDQVCERMTCTVASYPGPAQLFVACSMEKQGEPSIFSENGKKFGRTNRLCFAYCSTDYTLNARCVRQLPPAS